MEIQILIDTVDRYCAVWNEPVAARRAELLSGVWADGATYTDPSVHAAGASELLAHIGRVLAARPGARVVRTGDVAAHHGSALFFWHVARADGTFSPEGLDIAEFTPDGTRITRIIGYFGPLPQGSAALA